MVNNHSKRILIVEDEDVIRLSLVKLLQRHNYTVSEAVSVTSALRAFNLNQFDLIISDLRLPGGSGVELITLAKEIPVLIMTSYASLRSAVEIMRKGAADYVSKPFDHDELITAIERIFEDKKHETFRFSDNWDPLIGSSPQVLEVLAKLRRVAPTDAAVLISGEVGSGKRIVARAIHNTSQWKSSEYITINCRTVSTIQLEGYIDHVNTLSSCSIFLADLCDLPQIHQNTMTELVRRDKVRCIASTSENLSSLSNQGKFARDLLLETEVVIVNLPALRERPADIADLSAHFIGELSQERRTKINISDASIAVMQGHSWPGNIRELKNRLHQASLLLSDDQVITPDLLEFGMEKSSQLKQAVEHANMSGVSAPHNTKTLESYLVNYVLENQNNMSETQLAKNLGISRKNLWERRKKLQIPRPAK
jgi:DNA-binding NtrC family response regulator